VEGFPNRAFQDEVGACFVRGTTRVAGWRTYEARLEVVGVEKGRAGAELGNGGGRSTGEDLERFQRSSQEARVWR
jgi:hypothetical protein